MEIKKDAIILLILSRKYHLSSKLESDVDHIIDKIESEIGPVNKYGLEKGWITQ